MNEAERRNKAKQPDKTVHCSYCGRRINLRHGYGHYDHTKWNNKYKCEDCYYHPGHQYR